MYLLDTDAFALTSPTSGLHGTDVEKWRDWVRRNDAGLYLSVITIMEVSFGIEKLATKGARRKATYLARWLAVAETAYRGRIMPVTMEIAHLAGELCGAVAAGTLPSSEDATIAATASVYGLHLLSRNRNHMQALKGALDRSAHRSLR